MRYWSLCIGGLSTQTSGCLADLDVKPTRDGFVYLVVGPEELRTEAARRKMNFLHKGNFLSSVLIYRNLLTREDFAGNFAKLPTWPAKNGENPEELNANKHIGDYGPLGRHCSVDEYKKYGCIQ